MNKREYLKKRLDEGMPRSDIPSYKRAWNKTGAQLRKRHVRNETNRGQ